jgi:hypothetical protein|tara:strand:+ start:97 stop:318 length:222 start_codon:yes stop_codon:yes gene_type:complete
MIYRHEDFVLDMTTAIKAILYKGGRLIFMGDGYKAINIMIQNSIEKDPVKEMFHKQLTQRERPRFKASEKKPT